MELCSYCGKKEIILTDQEWLCNNCGAVMENTHEFGLTQIPDSNNELPRILDRNKIESNLSSYDLIDYYIGPKFNLNNYTCKEIKYLLYKCDKLDKRRSFHKSELLGACTYIAALEKGIVSLRKRRYKDTYRYRRRELHTTERIADGLNTLFASIKVNGVMYRKVRSDRLRQCAERLAKDLSLPIYSKIQIDPVTDTIYKKQVERVEYAIADIIIEKLQLRSPATKTKPFDRVWRAFMSMANKIDKRNLLNTHNLLTSRGHLRAPNVIAAALIYKVFRNQVTIRELRKAAGCGDKSLQKVLRIIMCSTKYP